MKREAAVNLKRFFNPYIVKFLFVGGFLSFVGTTSLLTLVEIFHMEKVVAQAISILITLELSFILHRTFTWGNREGTLMVLWVRFHTARAGVLFLTQSLFVVLVLVANLNYVIVSMILSSVGSLLNYLASDKLVFPSKS